MESSAPTNAQPAAWLLHLQSAFKLALSLVLFYWFALSTNWDLPKYGALAIVLISLDTTGASLSKGLLRVLGTTFGVAVGLLILACFSHDRWLTILAFVCYLTVIGYFMQGSRYAYAWFCAAFVPLVIWASNYPDFPSAFYFGTFRWLETTVGVIIYTVVCTILWPRRAADQLGGLGVGLWAGVRELYEDYREQLRGGALPAGARDLSAKVAGTLARASATLHAAYADTSEMGAHRRVWDKWNADVRALVDALELWRESIADCRELDLQRLLPRVDDALETVEMRLQRVSILWQAKFGADVAMADDDRLTESPVLDLDRSACADLSHFERAALMSFVAQLQVLQAASRELLLTMRILVGLDSLPTLRAVSPVRRWFQLPPWDAERFARAPLPGAAFLAGCILWIFTDPPTGPSIPEFAAILSLLTLLAPANPLALAAILVLSLFVAVAPVYWLVMPGLSHGGELLLLVFAFAFLFGYLGSLKPVLKTPPLAMFVVATGIGNQQVYSFTGLVDAALMLILAALVIGAVHAVFASIRPEQAFLKDLRLFFRGCARVSRGLSWQPGPGRRLAQRCLASTVIPGPAKIDQARQRLDYKLFPDNAPDQMQRLVDCIHSISYRLQSLEAAHRRIALYGLAISDASADLRRQVQTTMQAAFDRWANLQQLEEPLRQALQRLALDVEHQFDALASSPDGKVMNDSLRAELYTLLGSFRGLTDAMAETYTAMSQIDFELLASPRF